MQIELDPDLEDHHVGFKLPASKIEEVFFVAIIEEGMKPLNIL